MSVFNSLPPKINQYHLIKWLRANYPFLNKKNLSLNVLNSERDKNYLILSFNQVKLNSNRADHVCYKIQKLQTLLQFS